MIVCLVIWLVMAAISILTAEFGPIYDGVHPNKRERIVIYTAAILFAPGMLVFVGLPNLIEWTKG